MTSSLSRRALAAGAAGFAALGAVGAFAVMNAVGGNPVVNFAPAAATNDSPTTTAANASPDDRPGCDHDGGRGRLDDATTAKVKASAEKAVTDATFKHARHDRSNPDGYVAMMKKADGTRVLVHEDANFAVTKVQDPAPPRGRGGPGRPGRRPRGEDRAPQPA
jgi:hypothetical protein